MQILFNYMERYASSKIIKLQVKIKIKDHIFYLVDC